MDTNNILLMLFPVALLFLIFFKADFSMVSNRKGKETALLPEGEFLTQSKYIRAATCVAIILHHLVQYISKYGAINKGPVNYLNDMGIHFTALFFLFSGYGLVVSFYSKPGYLDHFFSKRILVVLIPFWISNLAGILLNLVLYGRLDLKTFPQNLIGTRLYNGNGWFIVELVIFYVLFYVLFRFIKKKDVALVLMCIAPVVMMAYSFMQGHDLEGTGARWFTGEWWFNSTFSFTIGLLCGRFKDSLNAFVKKHYAIVTCTVSVLFILSFIATIYAVKHLGYYHDFFPYGKRDAVITMIVQNISATLFALTVILVNKKIPIGNKVLKFLSAISFELFLIHGYFLHDIFGGVKMPEPLLFLAVIAPSVLAAYLLWLLDSFLIDKAKERLGKLSENKKTVKLLVVLAAVAIVLGIALVLFSGRRYLLAKSEYSSELETLKQASVGDEVQFGHFNTDNLLPGEERLTWIVIEKDGDKIRLLSKYGIDGSYYNQKHAQVSWKASDLRRYLNSDKFMNIFSTYESPLLTADPETQDMISLLSAEDATALFTEDPQRELISTSAAVAAGTNRNDKSKANGWDMKDYHTSWWWLRGNSDPQINAPIVTEDGQILEDNKPVNKPSGAIRPVIWLSLETG